MKNIETFLLDIPEITEHELEEVISQNSEGITQRFYFWANKSSLRRDTQRGRLYGNWQRQVTAPCMVNAKLYINLSDIIRIEELSDSCRNGDKIIEILSKGYAHTNLSLIKNQINN